MTFADCAVFKTTGSLDRHRHSNFNVGTVCVRRSGPGFGFFYGAKNREVLVVHGIGLWSQEMDPVVIHGKS